GHIRPFNTLLARRDLISDPSKRTSLPYLYNRECLSPLPWRGLRRFEQSPASQSGILSRDERSRCEIASGAQLRGEEIWNGVDGDQNPDPLGWQSEGEEEWREDDERAARDARDAEGEEDRGEGDRRQAAEVQRDAVEPADE